MAFAAAASARSIGVTNPTSTSSSATEQQPELSVQSLSQKVWTLVQTTMTLEAASRGVGGTQDSQTLRQRIASADSSGIALMNEIERGIRTVRVGILGGTNHTQQKALKSLEELYTEKRDLFVKAVNESRLRRTQIPAPGAKGSSSTGNNNPLAVANLGGSSRAGGGGGGGVGEINIQLEHFTEVDAAIIEERNQEAMAIAQDAVALHKVTKDLSVLVNEQGEALQVIEKNVDTALEHVVAGNEELKVAEKLNTSSRKKCCFIWFLIIALIIAITVPLCLHYISNPFTTGGK